MSPLPRGPPAQKGPLAFASVVLDGDYIVYGMRIIRRADGAPQLLYPEASHVRTSHVRTWDQKRACAFRPLSSTAHKRMEQAVLKAYENKIHEKLQKAADR